MLISVYVCPNLNEAISITGSVPNNIAFYCVGGAKVKVTAPSSSSQSLFAYPDSPGVNTIVFSGSVSDQNTVIAPDPKTTQVYSVSWSDNSGNVGTGTITITP